MSKTETLSIDLIRLDGGSQARIKSSEETIEAYAELIDASKGEWPFGPLDVFHDGSDYFLADGFHRTLAALRLSRASLPCRIHKGTAKDARIFGMTANDKHGLRMTRADKHACVEWLIENKRNLTQAEIAQMAGVDHRTVKRIVADRKEAALRVTMSPSVAKPSEKSTSQKPETASGADSKPASPDAQSPGNEPEHSPAANTDDDGIPEPAQPKNGKQSVSAASLVDALTKQHIGHIARGLTNIAAANGGEGKQFNRADSSLNQMITALQAMREGER